MTFLEWLITETLGEPTRQCGDGESYWPCPHCGHKRFHTMPVKPKFKHRFKCWRCDFRGDAADWLLELYPTEDYGARLDRLNGLRKEWAKHQDAEPESIFSGERGQESTSLEQSFLELRNLLEQPVPDWAVGYVAGMRALVWAQAIVDEYRISISDLARRCAEHLIHVKAERQKGERIRKAMRKGKKRR